MNKVKPFLITALITIVSFSAILYASCTKSKCSGVTCNNGGTCTGGKCSCATGYSGLHCELTEIIYQNNTYTKISIIINGTTDTIPVGASLAVYGTPGSAVTGTASTKGLYGNVYNWNVTDQFPAVGYSFTDPLNIGSDYFFLQVSNIDAYPINYLLVNPGTPYQTVENVSLEADRVIYGVGYYKSIPYSTITVKFSSGLSTTTDSIAIPATINAVYTLTVM